VPHPFLELPRPGAIRAIAHRGGGGPVENTLAAFSEAVAIGYHHLETDLHVTRDGVLVVAHDPVLTRVAGDPRAIADLTVDELADVRVGGRERVPRFEELIEAFPDARLTVDLKVDAAVEPMARLLAERPELLDRLCLGSFSSARVVEMRERFGSRLFTAATPREILRLLVAVRLRRRPPALEAGCVAVPERYPESGPGLSVGDARLVEVVSGLGLALHVWTVNDEERMRALVAAGVTGIVTDELTLLRGTLIESGRW